MSSYLEQHQANIATLARNLSDLRYDAEMLIEEYTQTGVSNEVAAIANGIDPVLPDKPTSLSKNEYSNTMFMIDQFLKFMTNEVVDQGDYISTANKAKTIIVSR